MSPINLLLSTGITMYIYLLIYKYEYNMRPLNQNNILIFIIHMCKYQSNLLKKVQMLTVD